MIFKIFCFLSMYDFFLFCLFNYVICNFFGRCELNVNGVQFFYGYVLKCYVLCNIQKDCCVMIYVKVIQCIKEFILNILVSDLDVLRVI